MLSSRSSLALGLGITLASCSLSPTDHIAESPEPTGQVAYALGTVDDAVASSCSTESVLGLSKQIVAQTNCIIPGALAEVPLLSNMTFSSTTFAYLQTPARDALVTAVKSKPGSTLGINSMFRAVSQQFLLYRWYQLGTCGISLAAQPGNSPHESALAFDTSDYTAWKATLQSNNYSWQGTGDPVHYTYVGPGIIDLSGKGVLAFQMLWNLNNPGDLIAEDGDYGPQTEARLKKSPAAGFAKGKTCIDNLPPKGNLDGADCDRVWGWAQDPNELSKAIDVHVYFNGAAGDSNAHSEATTAGLSRADLCTPLGSCEHGFELRSPFSLHDNANHSVRAYGIDSAAGANAELAAGPKTLKCAPKLSPAIRRHILNATSMTAWSFNAFWDQYNLSDAQLQAIAEWNALGSAPTLVKSDDGTSTIWLVDGGWKRKIGDMSVFAAWRFNIASVKTWAAKDVNALTLGTALRSRPALVKGSGANLYLLDDEQPAIVQPADAGADSANDTGTDTGQGADTSTTLDSGIDSSTTKPDSATVDSSTKDSPEDSETDSSKEDARSKPGSSFTAEDNSAGCACQTKGKRPIGSRYALGLIVGIVGLSLIRSRGKSKKAESTF